jgi:RNA polymerase sigma-70 factor (ECF subfamily)
VGEPIVRQAPGVILTPEVLCARYAGRVYRFAAMISSSSHDADDLAQTALERAIRGLSAFDENRGEIEGWLWRIVANAARDTARSARRRRLLLEALIHSVDRSARQGPPETPDEALLAAVRALPDRQRIAIALRYGADLSLRAVAATLGLSEPATGMLIRRALDRLRRELTPEENP